MEITIRKALETDINSFVDFSEKLSQFNRNNHPDKCKYDDYNLVLKSIREKAALLFKTNSSDVIIFIAEANGISVGYALGRIYLEEITADNGTGKIGLIDELYIDDSARGKGIGKKLVDRVMSWIKEKGVSRVKLHAYSWNKNAIALYENLGFVEYAVAYEKFI